MPVNGTLDRVLRGRFVLAEVMDEQEPPADLVLAQRPENRELLEAISVIGAFSDGSYLSGEVRISLLTL